MKRKILIRDVLFFIIAEMFLTLVTAPLIIFYGPFQNLKSTVVGSAMTTLNHQYIAKIFLPNEKINNILNKNLIVYGAQKNIDEIEKNIETRMKENKMQNLNRYDIKSSKFKGYVIMVNNPYSVKIGFNDKNSEGKTTSQLAKYYDASAAVNGGGFAYSLYDKMWVSNGNEPSNIIIADGKLVYKGKIKNDTKISIVGLTDSGVLILGKHSIDELKQLNVIQALSFGPPIIVNGEGTIKNGDGGWGIAPRTCIGQRKDGTIILLVIDGRQPSYSYGAALIDVQNAMLKLGAYNAVNLDGGNSSTMFFDGKVINNPCSPTGERAVASIIYVK